MRQLVRCRHSEKSGISGIIGGVIIFVVLFLVVIAFFSFEMSARTSQNQAENQRFLLDQLSNKELFSTTAVPNSQNSLVVNVSNYGRSTIVIHSIIVGYVSTDTVIKTSTNLNLGVKPFASITFNTGVAYDGVSHYWFRIQTISGKVGMALFPPPVNPNNNGGGTALNAISAGAIGDIYMNFSSFSWYRVYNSSSGCTSTSGLCLQQPGHEAFTIYTDNTTLPFAFAVELIDLNPQHLSITLENFTDIFEFWPTQSSSFRSADWFIVYNSTDTNIDATYKPIVLDYNVSKTVVFADAPTCTASNCRPTYPIQGEALQGSYVAPVGLASTFIFAHGWEKAPLFQPPDYGQNLPFVSTLYKNSTDIASTFTSCTPITSSTTSTTTTTLTATSTSYTTFPTTTSTATLSTEDTFDTTTTISGTSTLTSTVTSDQTSISTWVSSSPTLTTTVVSSNPSTTSNETLTFYSNTTISSTIVGTTTITILSTTSSTSTMSSSTITLTTTIYYGTTTVSSTQTVIVTTETLYPASTTTSTSCTTSTSVF